MTAEQRYFEFLHFCVTPDAAVPESTNDIVWHDLLDFANKQSLTGVFFYGMQRLVGHPNKPTDDDVMEWFYYVRKIVDRNRLMYEKCRYVQKTFLSEGFRGCILKGQGNAMMYPDAYSRTSGDIDIWLEGGDKKVISYIKRIVPKAKAVYHHIDFEKVKDVSVEVHYRPSFMNNMIANRRLQKYFETEAPRQFANEVSLPDEMGKICVPTDDFNRIFQMTHISNHFFHEGIGLRQLVDYYLILKRGFTEEERKRDEEMFQKLGIRKFVGAVMYVLKVVLGLRDNEMLVPIDEKRGRFLLKEIMIAGNFGFYDTRFGNDTKAGPLQKNLQRLYRDLRFAWLFPSESLWEPIFRLWHFFWRKRNG